MFSAMPNKPSPIAGLVLYCMCLAGGRHSGRQSAGSIAEAGVASLELEWWNEMQLRHGNIFSSEKREAPTCIGRRDYICWLDEHGSFTQVKKKKKKNAVYYDTIPRT